MLCHLVASLPGDLMALLQDAYHLVTKWHLPLGHLLDHLAILMARNLVALLHRRLLEDVVAGLIQNLFWDQVALLLGHLLGYLLQHFGAGLMKAKAFIFLLALGFISENLKRY